MPKGLLAPGKKSPPAPNPPNGFIPPRKGCEKGNRIGASVGAIVSWIGGDFRRRNIPKKQDTGLFKLNKAKDTRATVDNEID